jgi:hypothetical protein
LGDFEGDLVRILAKGRTYRECQLDVIKKNSTGWKEVADIKFDNSFIGGRYVCVMENPDDPTFNKSKFNQYLGY